MRDLDTRLALDRDPAAARRVRRRERLGDYPRQLLLVCSREQCRAVADVCTRDTPRRSVQAELLEQRAALAPRARDQRAAVEIEQVRDLEDARAPCPHELAV